MTSQELTPPLAVTMQDFPKLGGGEDTDLFLAQLKGRVVSVPDAVVTHPWWTEGKRCYRSVHVKEWGVPLWRHACTCFVCP
jgi:hypothetical protein